jgi:hypothetical protein
MAGTLIRGLDATGFLLREPSTACFDITKHQA